jgi:hypothetical protein
MVEKVNSIPRTLWWLILLLAVPSAALAHRLDEYLQATLVSIEPGDVRLQMNFTPGVAVADRVLARIDTNHDGIISANEAKAYGELVRNHLLVRLDGRKLVLKLATSGFPAVTELRSGWGIIQIEFTADIGSLSPGRHKLSLENRHLPGLSVYLLNAAQPKSAQVQITRQMRNKHQSRGSIEFATLQSF